MATLPPATTISSSHFDDAVSRLPFCSGEALSLRNLQKQRLPISHSKQNAVFSVCERASAWRISATAASAPQKKMSFGVLEGGGEVSDEESVQEAAAEGSLSDWSAQWYPVSMIDDLDKRVPTAITIMGRHFVVSWDRTRQSWLVCDDKGPEMTVPCSDVQINGKRGSRSSPSNGSLESSSQIACASVYPSVEKDGLLWFWPDTRPEFQNIAARKPPPSIPALTDPAFKEKLHSMNLPYSYKKMIENLLEPAYLPFAHDEPQEDFLGDFEKRLTSTASHPSSRPLAYKARQNKHVLSNTNGCAHEPESAAFKSTKAVKNGNANAKLELSYAAVGNGALGMTNGSANASMELRCAEVQNGAPSKTNGSANAMVELRHAEVQNGAPTKTNGSANGTVELRHGEVQNGAHRSGSNLLGKINGSVGATMETLHEAKQSGTLDSSTSANDVEAVKVGRNTLVQSTEDGFQSGEVSSQSLLGDSDKEDLIIRNSLEPTTRISTSRGEATISRVRSSVMLKKPATVPRTSFEDKVSETTDPFSISSVSSDHDVITNGSLDLTSSLLTLRRLIFQKDFELARTRVKELYEKYPGDTDVLMEYAFVEKQLGDLVAAGSLYSQAISAFEDQQIFGYDYVRALQALGSIEARARNAKRARVLFMESIRAARKAEQLFPDLISGASVYGLHAWARLEEQQGNWAKARDLLARAAEIQPGNAVVHQSRALLEAKAHNWGAARHHFSLSVESAPEDVKCWHAWAIFEASQGKKKKMQDLFQKALEVDPYSVHCLQAWAHQETLIGTPESKDKARSLFQRCTQIEPKSLYAWQAWAVLEKASGNYDKARELFEKCLEINASSTPCLQAYANMERHLENWGSAQRLLRKALKLEPENAAVLMEAAFVENSLGNSEGAERLFVLAGMADKRKTKVTNRIFASRKEVMPSKAGKGWRGIAKRNRKPSTIFDRNLTTERQFNPITPAVQREEVNSDVSIKWLSNSTKATVDAFKNKQEDINRNLSVERQSDPIKAEVDAMNIIRAGAPIKVLPTNSSTERQSDPMKVAADLIKVKRQDFNSSSITERQSSVRLKQEDRNHQASFQVAADASKVKQRELKKNGDEVRQTSSHLKQKSGKSTSFKAAIDVGRQRSVHLKPTSTDFQAAIDVGRQRSVHLKPTSNDFQAAITAIKARKKELKGTKGQPSIYLRYGGNKSSPNFQAAIEAIDTKLREFKSDTDTEEQLPFPLRPAERAPSMLGA